MQCLILAGGLASRLRPLTDHIPKSLVPVNGIPFIDYQLKWLAQNGMRDILLSIGYRGELIRAHVGDGSRWNLKIQYTEESQTLLGTGGAIRLAWERSLLDPNFLVTYGDSYLPVQLNPIIQQYHHCGLPALMTVFKNNGAWDKSNVHYAAGRVQRYDKFASEEERRQFEYIDYGISILSSDWIENSIPSGERYDLAQLFSSLSKDGKLAGFEVFERFYEIGSLEGLKEFSQFIGS